MTEEEITRSAESLILQRLASAKYSTVAHKTHLTESQVSRIGSGQAGIKLHELGLFLDALGLRLADKEERAIDEKEYQALKFFARRALED